MTVAPANNFSVVRLQREIGRSNFGAHVRESPGVGDHARRRAITTAPTASIWRWQATTNGKLFAFIARTDSPESQRRLGLRRARVLHATPIALDRHAGYSQVGERSIPRSDSCDVEAYRQVEGRVSPDLPAEALAVDPPHFIRTRNFTRLTNLDNELESSLGTVTSSTSRPARRPLRLPVETSRIDPTPFTVYQDVTGRRVVIPPASTLGARRLRRSYRTERAASASAAPQVGNYYDGDYHGWELTVGHARGREAPVRGRLEPRRHHACPAAASRTISCR